MATAFWGTAGVIRIVFAYLLSLVQMFGAAILSADMTRLCDDWTPEKAFVMEDDTIVMEKEKDKDFVVINLSDIQLNEMEANMGDCRLLAYQTIKQLIDDNDPDLITVSGDNAWGVTAYMWFRDMMDSFGIPWAPVMGNHDGQHTFSENWCAYLLCKARNCLFRMGPDGMGHGNYIITVTEDGKPVHSLYMMDTHSSGLTEEQVEWYTWAVKGLEKEFNCKTESTAIMHIPCEEYEIAWNALAGEENADSEFGSRHERVCWEEDNGFFEQVVALGSTKNILAGHDHVNDFMLNWRGIGLNYSLKCGMGCYWEPGLNGGTVIRIGSDGQAVFSQDFVDPTAFPIWNFSSAKDTLKRESN